jgi:hypothetical protein
MGNRVNLWGMTKTSSGSSTSKTVWRTIFAVLIGLIGALVIWVITPYNDVIISVPWWGISNDYLPVVAMCLLLLIVLVVNPLLRRCWPVAALRAPQLALIMGILLVASVVPGQGLMTSLPYMLVNPPRTVRANERRAEDYREMNLPSSLFPDKLEYRGETPVADGFYDELAPDEPIPWRAWLAPLLAWTPLIFSGWLLMVGLAMIVLHQWRRNERLNFPLLTIQKSLLEDPEEGRALAPLFRRSSFWWAAASVLLLHSLLAAKQYFPSSIPAIPLSWNLRGALSEEPWRNLPGWLMGSRIFFTFVGVAFFMQTRISFSIWFFIVAYAFYFMIGLSYLPPFNQEIITEHRIGVMLSIALFVLWMGRAHWAAVARGLFRRSTNDVERVSRTGGWMFLAGGAGMYLWLLWVGLGPGWAAGLVLFVFLTALVLGRFVAETGMPFFRMFLYPATPIAFLSVLPFDWISRTAILISSVFGTLFVFCSRSNPTVMTTHALSLNEEQGGRGQVRMSALFLAVMLLGVVVSGAGHVRHSYRHGMTLDGSTRPVNAQGINQLEDAHRMLAEFGRGRLSQPNYNRPGHLLFGVTLGAGLYWLCLHSPSWPVHPMGIMMVFTYYGNACWASVLVGWLLKVLIVKYGGAQAYRRAQGMFIGLIIGELLAAIIWAIVPAILAAMGEPYKIIHIIG